MVRTSLRGFVCAVVLGLLCAAGVGCKERPGEPIARHMEAMVLLLEEHAADPDQAALAVEGYVAENREALRAVRRDLDARREGLSGDQLADLAARVLKDVGPVMERADRLMRARPRLAENERLLRALDTIRETP